MTHWVVRRAIPRCKCRGLVLANFCIFVPITERGGSQVWANMATKVTSQCSVLLNFCSKTFSLSTKVLLSVGLCIRATKRCILWRVLLEILYKRCVQQRWTHLSFALKTFPESWGIKKKREKYEGRVAARPNFQFNSHSYISSSKGDALKLV